MRTFTQKSFIVSEYTEITEKNVLIMTAGDPELHYYHTRCPQLLTHTHTHNHISTL